MRIIQASLLSLLLPVLLLAQPKRQPPPKSLVFTHVTVIDATGLPAKPEMTVVITGEHIAALGKTGDVRIPKNVQIVNAAGKFLIPGFWDMHVHIFNHVSRRPPNARYFPLFVGNGVTGVLEMWTKPQDMNQVLEWRAPLRFTTAPSTGVPSLVVFTLDFSEVDDDESWNQADYDSAQQL